MKSRIAAETTSKTWKTSQTSQTSQTWKLRKLRDCRVASLEMMRLSLVGARRCSCGVQISRYHCCTRLHTFAHVCTRLHTFAHVCTRLHALGCYIHANNRPHRECDEDPKIHTARNSGRKIALLPPSDAECDVTSNAIISGPRT